jgi:hypothetical protein
MGIDPIKVAIATTGSSGSATGTVVVPLPPCELLAVFVDFGAAPSTTDTTFKAIGGEIADNTILTLTNSNSDAWYFPGEQVDDNTGSAVTGAYRHPLIHNNLSIDIAQADALSPCLTVYLFVRI